MVRKESEKRSDWWAHGNLGLCKTRGSFVHVPPSLRAWCKVPQQRVTACKSAPSPRVLWKILYLRPNSIYYVKAQKGRGVTIFIEHLLQVRQGWAEPQTGSCPRWGPSSAPVQGWWGGHCQCCIQTPLSHQRLLRAPAGAARAVPGAGPGCAIGEHRSLLPWAFPVPAIPCPGHSLSRPFPAPAIPCSGQTKQPPRWHLESS